MTGGISLDASLGGASSATAIAGVLDACDRLLGEIGRRQHRFAWLHDDDGEWFVLDAYYPGSRVVVLCHPDPEVRRLVADAARERGLRPAALDPAEIGREDDAALIEHRLAAAGWAPGAPAPPAVAPASDEPVVSRVVRPAEQEQRFGLSIGLALCALVLLEAYLGAVVLAAQDGRVIIGFGLLLDGCARAFGTVSAGQDREHALAWACLVLGSPIVAWRRPHPGEAARVAGVVAVAALAVVGLGLLLLALGS